MGQMTFLSYEHNVKALKVNLTDQTRCMPHTFYILPLGDLTSGLLTIFSTHHSIFYGPDVLPAAQQCQITEGTISMAQFNAIYPLYLTILKTVAKLNT